MDFDSLIEKMDFIDGKECKLIQKALDYRQKWYNDESDSDGNDIDDDDITNNVQLGSCDFTKSD